MEDNCVTGSIRILAALQSEQHQVSASKKASIVHDETKRNRVCVKNSPRAFQLTSTSIVDPGLELELRANTPISHWQVLFVRISIIRDSSVMTHIYAR